METLTNNNNEAYNQRNEKKLGHKPHPNSWIFVELIQKEELFMSLKYIQIESDIYKGPSRIKTLKLLLQKTYILLVISRSQS